MREIICHKKASRNVRLTINVEAAISKAYLMVKQSASATDGAALITKTITLVPSADGQIENAGSAGPPKVPAVCKFTFAATDCDSLQAPSSYSWSIKCIEGGQPYVPEDNEGAFTVLPAGVEATS